MPRPPARMFAASSKMRFLRNNAFIVSRIGTRSYHKRHQRCVPLSTRPSLVWGGGRKGLCHCGNATGHSPNTLCQNGHSDDCVMCSPSSSVCALCSIVLHNLFYGEQPQTRRTRVEVLPTWTDNRGSGSVLNNRITTLYPSSAVLVRLHKLNGVLSRRTGKRMCELTRLRLDFSVTESGWNILPKALDLLYEAILPSPGWNNSNASGLKAQAD